jgi:hypothetical protein
MQVEGETRPQGGAVAPKVVEIRSTSAAGRSRGPLGRFGFAPES